MSNPKKKVLNGVLDSFEGHEALIGKRGQYGNVIPNDVSYDMFGRFLNLPDTPGTKAFPLNDREVNSGGINAMYVGGADRFNNANYVPTYKGTAVLPEITITPESSYFYNPIHDQAWKIRKSLTNVPTLQPKRYYSIKK